METGFMLNSSKPKPNRINGIRWLCRHLPANGHWNPGLMGRLDHPSDDSQNGRMEGFIEIGDMLIDPIDGQGILDQVVRSDAEEIHLSR